VAKEHEIDFNFGAGLNVDVPEALLSKEELLQADNADILPRGGFKKRDGLININETAYEDKVKQIIEFPREDGTSEILAIIGNQLAKINMSDGTKTDLQTVQADRVPYFFIQDDLYFIDPGEEYYRYNGTSVSAVSPKDEEDNDLAPIRRCKYAQYHIQSNRIFFAGDSENTSAVYYSEFNEPNYVKAISRVHPTRNDGKVIGLNILMDTLIAHFPYSNYIWRGIDPTQDAIWERLPTAHGPLNDDLSRITTDSLTIVSKGGIMNISPSIIGIPMDNEVGSSYLQNISKERVNSILQSIENKEKARSVFDSDTGKFYLAYSDTAGDNNKILVFDFEQKAFSQYVDININDFCKLTDGTLLMASDDYILEWTDDAQDIMKSGEENIIRMDVKTPIYTFGNPLRNKQISRIYTVFRNYGENHRLDFELIIDGEKVREFSVNGDNSQKNYLTFRYKTTYKGRDFQLRIINDQYSPAEVYAVGFLWKMAETGGEII